MEKRSLTLIRHATAAYRSGSDFDRPLSKPGRIQACELGRVLWQAGVRADLIVYSAATRTTMTAEQIALSFAGAQLVSDERLYGGSPWEIFEIVQQYQGISSEGVFVVGHEPIVSMTAAALVQDDENIGGVVSTATAIVTDPIVELGRIGQRGAHFRARYHVPVRG